MSWNDKIIKKAGGIVRDGEKFFVVKRDNYNDISLPKWHIDVGEAAETAALREVLEETWLECHIVWDLWTTEYTNFEWIVQVQYFAMKVKQKISEELFPDVSEVISGNYSEIVEILSYETDKIIFEKWARFFELMK